jgi:hypothetical protein
MTAAHWPAVFHWPLWLLHSRCALAVFSQEGTSGGPIGPPFVIGPSGSVTRAAALAVVT